MKSQHRNMCNKIFLSVFILLFILTSCSQKKESKLDDFNKTVFSPEYATGFEIKGAEGMESTIVEVKNPWQGADSVTMQLFIARDGESAPDGFKGQVLEGDAKRIVAMSSTHIAMLDVVDATDCVVGVSGADFITNPKIQARAKVIRNDSTLERPVVVIKATPEARWESLISALDEMQINQISRYQIDNINGVDSAMIIMYRKSHPKSK